MDMWSRGNQKLLVCGGCAVFHHVVFPVVQALNAVLPATLARMAHENKDQKVEVVQQTS